MHLDRRLFIQGLLATTALPVFARSDGVALTSASHPIATQAVAADLSEEALMSLWVEVRGYDAYGNPIKEVLNVGNKEGLRIASQSKKRFRQVTEITTDTSSIPIFMSWGQ